MRCCRGWGDTGPCLAPNLCTSTGCRAEWLESSFAGKAQRVLVDIKLTTSQQCTLAAKATDSLRGCVRQSIASWSRKMIFPQPGEAASGGLCPRRAVSSSGLPSSRDMDVLELVQRRATRMIKGLEHLLNEVRLSELGLFSMEKKRFGGFHLCV